MNRLTEHLSDGNVRKISDPHSFVNVLNRLAAYEDTGLEPEEVKAKLDGLDEFQKLEAEGRLVVLPCRVGDTVYQTDGVRVYELAVRRLIFDTATIAFDESAIGKTVFLSREEAEAKLKEAEEND